MGLSRENSMTMAAQTVMGSAKMVLSGGSHPGALKDMVCSPGGTTIAGVQSLEENGFRAAAMAAVEAATIRSQELHLQSTQHGKSESKKHLSSSFKIE
jgi:pyrroline-5-carboxylate reductase